MIINLGTPKLQIKSLSGLLISSIDLLFSILVWAYFVICLGLSKRFYLQLEKCLYVWHEKVGIGAPHIFRRLGWRSYLFSLHVAQFAVYIYLDFICYIDSIFYWACRESMLFLIFGLYFLQRSYERTNEFLK